MRKVLLSLVTVSLALGSLFVQAEPVGGKLYFSGMIVNAGCLIEVNQQEANYQCYRQGFSHQRTQMLSQDDQLENTQRSFLMPASLGTSEVKWMQGNSNKGIINVSYF